MTHSQMVDEFDRQISVAEEELSRLKQAREILAGPSTPISQMRGRRSSRASEFVSVVRSNPGLTTMEVASKMSNPSAARAQAYKFRKNAIDAGVIVARGKQLFPAKPTTAQLDAVGAK